MNLLMLFIAAGIVITCSLIDFVRIYLFSLLKKIGKNITDKRA